MGFWIAAITQGLAFVALAWGVYLSARVLRFADISPDGTFPLGAAVCAALLVHDVPPLLASLAALGAGMLAGYITASLHTRLGVTDLLSGILMMTALLVLQEASRSIGVAGQVLSLAAREGYELLDAPPSLVAPPDTPVPFAPELEDGYLPSRDGVRRALEELLAY